MSELQLPRRIIRLKELEHKTGLKKDAIYSAVREGRLPQPVQLGPRVSGWFEHEVDQALAEAPRGLRNPLNKGKSTVQA